MNLCHLWGGGGPSTRTPSTSWIGPHLPALRKIPLDLCGGTTADDDAEVKLGSLRGDSIMKLHVYTQIMPNAEQQQIWAKQQQPKKVLQISRTYVDSALTRPQGREMLLNAVGT